MKPKFLYLNYHASPDIKVYANKLEKYKASYEILNYLKDKYEVVVIDHIGANEQLEKDGITYFAKKKKRNNKWLIPFKLHQEIKALQPEIIYLHSLMQMHYLIFLAPFLSKKTKIMVQHHAERPPRHYKKWILRLADHLVDQYFFTSEKMSEEWINQHIIASKSKVTEVTEGSTFFKSDEQVPRKKQSYLWVARLNKNKDPITVVNAFIHFLEDYPTAELTMIFSTNELLNDIEQILTTHRLAKNKIKLLGKFPNEELETIYQQHEFFVLASIYEGGSFALIEAIACGCIPIVSDIPANRAITNYQTGDLLFTPGDEKGIVHQLKRSQSTPMDINRRALKDYFDKELSFRAIARKIDQAIEKL